MPKANKQKVYAVAVGRGAPGIYHSWNECSEKVTRYPNALHRSFNTREEAEDWLASKSDIIARHLEVTSVGSRERQLKLREERGTRDSPISLDSDDEQIPQILRSMNQNTKCQPEAGATTTETTPVLLSSEQSKVLNRVLEKKNVFFTGSAGTGKSVLLREIIRVRGGGDRHRVAITASTGIAAVNIGGTTLHSWTGIGLGLEPAKNIVGKFLKQRAYESVVQRWQRVETLIIDEISMIDGLLFDKLEFIARRLRRSDSPFGGIQLVLCGDFCQLPPVSGRDEKGRAIPAKFAFQADSWDQCIGAPMILTKVFRQKDQTFIDMLNEMRYGRMKDSTIQIFKSLSRRVQYTDGIEPTELYPTRREVDSANQFRLRQISSDPQVYEADDKRGKDSNGHLIPRERMVQLLDRVVVPRILTLKVGAQVMLVKNLRQGILVNGSVGQIIKFSTASEALKDLQIQIDQNEPEKGKEVSPAILQSGWKWPVVRFTNGMVMLLTPADFTIYNADGEMEAEREQLPLILSWALSVHKSQGQTLERVRVDLRRTFEKGQAYVALSRATSLAHLEVLNFEPKKVMAHPLVLEWYGVQRSAGSDYEIDDDEMVVFDEYHL